MKKLGIHESYNQLQGDLLHHGVVLRKGTLYRKLLAHSNEVGHERRKRHMFSEESIKYLLGKTLADYYGPKI